MNKVIQTVLCLTLITLIPACANRGSTATAPQPQSSSNDPIRKLCHAKNIKIKIQLDQGTSIPELKNKAQRAICVASGVKITWQRDGADKDEPFTLFFKGTSVKIPSKDRKAEYIARNVSELEAFSYGIEMSDANNKLDPIIIIIPQTISTF